MTVPKTTPSSGLRRLLMRLALLIALAGFYPPPFRALGDWPEIGPEDVRVSFTGADADSSFNAAQPRVAYNPSAREYLVVWSAVAATNPRRTEIMGQRVSALSGERVGSVIAISVEQPGLGDYTSEMPDVVYNGVDQRYFVVWHRFETNKPFQVFGRFINAVSSAPLGSDNLTLVNWGAHNGNNIFDEDRIRVAYSPAAGRYYLVWASTPTSTTAAVSRVQGISIAADGQTVYPLTDFTGPLGLGQPTAADSSPAVVYNPVADEFLVVWLGIAYWYMYERSDAAVFAQRVTAATGQAIGVPLIVSRDERVQMPRRALYPDVAYASPGSFLLTWVGTEPYTLSPGTIQLRWLPTDLENRLPTVFSAVPQSTACVGTQPVLSFVPGEGRGLIAWSSGDGNSMSGSPCTGGTQIFGVPIAVGQDAIAAAPTQLSEMGPVGGTKYRAFRPAVAAALTPRGAFVAWYGNDELPGVASDKLEVFGQQVDLSLYVRAPIIQNRDRPPFSTLEVEPNNSGAEANGPLRSGVSVSGYANDVSDYYRLTVTAAGTLTAALTNPQGQGTQLQLYREPVSTNTLVQSDGVPPYALSAGVTPGVYYVRVYTAGGYTSAVPYSLQVIFP